tara:strand:+ start:96 stop:308 length:213 start_codon:yes stop_codon:yes gene_type:complete
MVMSLQERLETVEGRTELLRHWAGNVPIEALRLIPSLFALIDEREEEIQSLRRERDTLVEAYLNESYRKA